MSGLPYNIFMLSWTCCHLEFQTSTHLALLITTRKTERCLSASFCKCSRSCPSSVPQHQSLAGESVPPDDRIALRAGSMIYCTRMAKARIILTFVGHSCSCSRKLETSMLNMHLYHRLESESSAALPSQPSTTASGDSAQCALPSCCRKKCRPASFPVWSVPLSGGSVASQPVPGMATVRATANPGQSCKRRDPNVAPYWEPGCPLLKSQQRPSFCTQMAKAGTRSPRGFSQAHLTARRLLKIKMRPSHLLSKEVQASFLPTSLWLRNRSMCCQLQVTLPSLERPALWRLSSFTASTWHGHRAGNSESRPVLQETGSKRCALLGTRVPAPKVSASSIFLHSNG